jgi:hypothetical protein
MLKKMDDARNAQIRLPYHPWRIAKASGTPVALPTMISLYLRTLREPMSMAFIRLSNSSTTSVPVAFCCGLSTSGTAVALLMPAHSRRGLGYA